MKSDYIDSLLSSFETRYNRGKAINNQYYSADYENLNGILELVEKDSISVSKLFNPRAVLLLNVKKRLEKMCELLLSDIDPVK